MAGTVWVSASACCILSWRTAAQSCPTERCIEWQLEAAAGGQFGSRQHRFWIGVHPFLSRRLPCIVESPLSELSMLLTLGDGCSDSLLWCP